MTTIHAEAIHNRAAAARTQAKLDLTVFRLAILDHLAIDCPPAIAPHLASYHSAMLNSAPGIQHVSDLGSVAVNYLATLNSDSPIRSAYYNASQSISKAEQLTVAAQTVQYRLTIK